MKKRSFLFAAFVAAMSVLMVPAVRGEVLVYEGFGPSDYNIGSGQSAQGTANNYPVTSPLVDAIGVGDSKSKWQAMSTSKVKVYGSYRGLDLPEALKNAGFTAIGGAIGLNNGENYSELKAMNHALTASLNRSEGKLFLRMLLCIDSKAAGKLVAGDTMSNKSGGYYGFGIMKKPSKNDYYMLSQATSPSAIGFAIWKNNSSQYVLSLALTDASGASSNYPIITGISMDTTYVCYAEIDIGADADAKEIVKAGAMSNADFTELPVWQQNEISVQLMTDAVYPDCMAVMGPYGSNGGFFRADEIRIGTEITDVLVADADAPSLGDVSLSSRKADGSYDVAIAVAKNAGVLKAIARTADDDASPIVVSSAAEVSAPNGETLTLSGLAADSTYQILAAVENAVGAETNKVGTIYSGALTLEKVKDAREYRCEAGEVLVSRASADPYPLTVNYTLSSDAEDAAEGRTWVAPQPVTIPAGATSATLTLKPIVDSQVAEDITVTLALGDGNYAKPNPASVVLTLANIEVPDGYNTWIAASDGRASEGANWSKGVPTATDRILFDGNFSTANCEWDAGVPGVALPTTVAGWTQRDGYTGVVTVDTEYSGSFSCLTVTGDMDLESGVLSQHTNTTANTETYRLRIDVKGDLTVAAGAKIDVSGCGPNNDNATKSIAYAADMTEIGSTFGDPKLPTACGKAGQNKSGAGGGGAVYMTVGGKTTLDGDLLAEGVRTINPNGSSFDGWGCGGSVYLETGSFAGSGIMSVSTPLRIKGEKARGTPGRISVWSKTVASEFPVDNLRAWGDFYETDYNVGAGTVVVRNPGEANGTLYVRNNPGRTFSYNYTVPQQTQTTSIPKSDTWVFDAVVLGNYGVLTVPEMATLVLPNGFASVSCLNSGAAASNAKNGHCGLIVRDGGAVVAPAVGGKHEFKGGCWTFCPCTQYTLTGNVEVSGGANVGVPLVSQGTNGFLSCNVKVVGDMDVKVDGLVSAEYGGIGGTGTFASQGYVPFEDAPIGGGKANGTGHGGQKGTFAGNNAYDSFFDPHLPGSAGGSSDQRNVGGGVITLEVTGTLNVDGKISSSVQTFATDTHAGGAGSVNVRAGALTGSGRIVANTTPSFSDYAKAGYGSYGGGRVAVRLTGEGAAFDDHWFANITAKGYSKVGAVPSGLKDDNLRYSSAGSVYLQAGAEEEKCGTIVIRNDGVTENTAWTSLPAAKETDQAEDFKRASLALLDCGKVRIYESLQMANLTLAENSKLDLNGKTLTVMRAKFGGARVRNGEHRATDDAVSAYVTDSSPDGSGRLVVIGRGLLLMIW